MIIEELIPLIEDQIDALKDSKIFKSIKDVQSFLGLTGYFRKFINQYSLLAKPLNDLLRKNRKIQFGPDEQKAFSVLKEKLANEPVLKFFDRAHETELHTDASKDGIAAVLLQRSPSDLALHPTHYLSHNTSLIECKYSSYDLEVFAIVCFIGSSMGTTYWSPRAAWKTRSFVQPIKEDILPLNEQRKLLKEIIISLP